MNDESKDVEDAMSIKSSRIAACAIFALAMGAAGLAAADTSAPIVLLRTATVMVKDSPNGKVGRQTGAGVMDTSVAADDKGHIFMTWTDSVPNNDNAGGVQGAIAIADLTGQGLNITLPPTELPALKGERTHMRPQAAIGQNFLLDIFASEDNGNNDNPQAVAWVFDRNGTMLAISNTTRNRNDAAAMKPTNLITLAKNNDNQQYGPHSVCALGPAADGNGEEFLLGVQRNNTAAYVMKVNVAMNADGTAKVTVPYLTKVVNNARHCRPQVECPPAGAALTRRTRVITSVEANNQPADIGVRAVLFDIDTGKAVNSKLIAASDPKNNKYAVQPSIAAVSENVVAIEWAQSANARKGAGRNGNGHTGGENLSMLTTLNVSDLSQLDQKSRIAPYQRHAHAMGATYGAGAGQPAVASMGGSSTGSGKGMMQMIPIDPASGKIGEVDPLKVYEVSKLSDVANLPARGKRNPSDQGAGFINGFAGLKNPGFGTANGFMPEVSSFTISAVPGFKDITTSTRESLFLSLVPATWKDQIATTPGPTTFTSDIQNGPSPTVSQPTPVPVGETPANPDPFGNGSGDSSGGDLNAGAGGCSVVTTAAVPSGMGALAVGMMAALLVVRTRRGRKTEEN
ncbi:MAG TPA: hypothetical protein VNO21_02125 [Polyangiaceae bacterium]|nr:hypothetical protein [Polyangiaceae bacterium]